MACSARGGWDQLRSLGVSAPFARGTRITTTSGAWEAVERSPASLAANVAGELAGTSDAWYADADRPTEPRGAPSGNLPDWSPHLFVR